MSLENFLKKTSSPKKTSDPIKLKELPKKESVLSADSAFQSDPIEMRPLLEEIASSKKADLQVLAKDYRFEGISSLNVEEAREALYAWVRAGHTKMKPRWEAKCGCDKTESFRSVKIVRDQPDPIRCKKCQQIIYYKRT